MIIAGIQFDIAWEEPEENFRRVSAMAEQAAGVGARLVVLPEMFATGFSMNADLVSGFAGETRDFLAGLARRLGVWVLGGYAEPGDERPFNACSVYDPEGAGRLHYRKIHPFSLAGEDEHYDGGAELPTADVEGVRVTPQICYDLRFPEPFRAAADRTDLYTVIANWPEKRSNAWRILLQARAIENQTFVLGVNRVGTGSGQPHLGDSALIDPFGHALASASRGPAVVLGEVTARAVEKARRLFSFLKDRRPDVYRRLDSSGPAPDAV